MLELHLGWLGDCPHLREALAAAARQVPGLDVAEDYRERHLGVPTANWAGQVQAFVKAVQGLVSSGRRS